MLKPLINAKTHISAMCVYVCVCVHVYIHVCIFVYMHVYACVCVCVCVCVCSVHGYMCACLCDNVYKYVILVVTSFSIIFLELLTLTFSPTYMTSHK